MPEVEPGGEPEMTLMERFDHVNSLLRMRDAAPPPDPAAPEELLDPDCRDGKHGSCVGGPCECLCHLDGKLHPTAPVTAADVIAQYEPRLSEAHVEIIRLRNRITALEANGSELLARAERAEAELAETQRRKTWAIDQADKQFRERRAAAAERGALAAELALHVGCRVDISIGDTLKLIRATDSPADAPSPVTAGIEAHGETTEAQEGSR